MASAHQIPLRNRQGDVVAHTIVDREDFERFGHLRWHLLPIGYAFRKSGHGKGEYLHRAILGFHTGDGRRTDHINGDQLDNRKANLRGATAAQNAQNKTKLHSANTSGYRGVGFHKRKKTKPWSGYAMLNGRQRFLGYYETPEEASDAVTDWRRQHMPFSSLDQVAA